MSAPRSGGKRLGDLEARLGYRFKDRRLLERALTHRSRAYESGQDRDQNYERLEFLGDALLGFVVSEWLWRDDPHADEGVLSRRKQTVVRASTLARVAKELGVGEALRLGRGEESTGGRKKVSLLADAFEAILGAIQVDGGLRSGRAFVRRQLGAALESTRSVEQPEDDYKTRLQERVQGRLRVTPRYRIVATSGPAHAREFEVEVLIGDEVTGSGRGASRKQAEQRAARMALLDHDDDET
jgi:ribonuclease-3